MVAVIGGGISGLATAYYLKKKNIPFTLYEANSKLGGIIQSKHHAGNTYEYGPNSLRDKSGALLELVKELELEDALISISEASKTRYLVKHGKLYGLNGSPLAIFKSNLLSWRGKCALVGEILKSPQNIENESVGEFFERRFGKEITQQLADPVFTGIYAGDIYDLNKEAVLGEIAEYEHTYGSLIKGLIKTSKQRKTPLVFSFDGGLQTLTNAISDTIQPHIKHERVENITYTSNGIAVHTNKASNSVDRIISTVPAYALAYQVRTMDSVFSQKLNTIPYSPIASIIVRYERSSISIPEDGFGFLIPSNEKMKLLGAIWRSSIFPKLVDQNNYVFNLMVGGAKNTEIIKNDPETIIRDALSEFNEILGITKPPLDIDYKLWEKGIPQFQKNYLNLINKIELFESKFPKIQIGGNFRWGVSVPDCIKGAKKLVDLMN